MTSPRSFFHPLPHGSDIPSPVHFRAWTVAGPYNLCRFPSANARWSPLRGMVTCADCRILLKGPSE